MMMVKTQLGQIGKTTTLLIYDAFLYISLLSVHVYDLKLPNVVFCRGWEYKTTISSFFCEVRYSPLKSNS